MSVDRPEALRLARICLPKIASCSASEADALTGREIAVKSLCRLWAGMGYIYQITITLPTTKQKHHFICKRVIPPSKNERSFGDERKASSYLVESNFYHHIAPSLIEKGLAIPHPYHVEWDEATDRVTICMSLLRGSPGYLDDAKAKAVLRWLSTLHSATWGSKVDAYVEKGWVQPIGSYWHLDTRPSEHDSMPRRGWEGRLKLAARAIDERLKRDTMQCCIHGDAKDANMLFGDDGEVSMYDFQYCGRAPPSVDLAYFLCVAVGDTDPEYVRYYHEQLVAKLEKSDKPPSLKELEDSVALALCDFQRFMSGWGQWGSDISSVVMGVLDRLDRGTLLKSEDAYREAVRREYG